MKSEKLLYFFSMILSLLINRFKKPGRLRFQNILIIKLDEMGDMTTATHLFALLKNTFPEASLTVWCKPVIESLILHDPHIKKIIRSETQLEDQYDLVLDLRGNWTALWYTLFHPPKYRVDRGTVRFLNKLRGKHPHEVYTNLQIAKPLLKHDKIKPEPKIYFSQADEAKVAGFLRDNQIGNFAIFHTGAGTDLRKWSGQRFATLADYIRFRKNLQIIFIGNIADRQEIEQIRAMIPFQTWSVAGKFSISAFAALVSKASLYVGNESGPLHVAAAGNIPTIGIFGPGEPTVFYPYGEKTAYVHHVLECNPCVQRIEECKYAANPCIARVKVEEVIQKMNELV